MDSYKQSLSTVTSHALTDLEAALTELTLKLQPVLMPTGPERDQVGTDPGMPPLSEIRSELYRIHTLTGAVRTLRDRLDI